MMRPTPHQRLVGFALVGVLVAPAVAAAVWHITDFSQEELRTLPRACLAQRFINDELDPPVVPEAERAQWNERVGPTFLHYHHYCWALLLMRRAAAPGGERYDYERVVDNLNYVIARADQSCALMPEIYFQYERPNDNPSYVLQPADLSCTLLPDVFFQKGSALEHLGQREAAVIEYQNALRVRTDYTPARAALVQVYLDRGEIQSARAELAEGLQYDPSSKALADEESALAAGVTKTP